MHIWNLRMHFIKVVIWSGIKIIITHQLFYKLNVMLLIFWIIFVLTIVARWTRIKSILHEVLSLVLRRGAFKLLTPRNRRTKYWITLVLKILTSSTADRHVIKLVLMKYLWSRKSTWIDLLVIFREIFVIVIKKLGLDGKVLRDTFRCCALHSSASFPDYWLVQWYSSTIRCRRHSTPKVLIIHKWRLIFYCFAHCKRIILARW